MAFQPWQLHRSTSHRHRRPGRRQRVALGLVVVAGAIGMLCYYAAIKGAPLTKVMPIAFTSPLFGALTGILFGQEPLTWKIALGTLLTLAGIIVLTV